MEIVSSPSLYFFRRHTGQEWADIAGHRRPVTSFIWRNKSLLLNGLTFSFLFCHMRVRVSRNSRLLNPLRLIIDPSMKQKLSSTSSPPSMVNLMVFSSCHDFFILSRCLVLSCFSLSFRLKGPSGPPPSFCRELCVVRRSKRLHVSSTGMGSSIIFLEPTCSGV